MSGQISPSEFMALKPSPRAYHQMQMTSIFALFVLSLACGHGGSFRAILQTPPPAKLLLAGQSRLSQAKEQGCQSQCRVAEHTYHQ
jgi:hypothetical protein